MSILSAIRGRKRSRGQSVVEFALVLPILLLLLAATIDFGRLFYLYVAVNNAAKEGALYGARSPLCDDSANPACGDPNNVAWHVANEAANLVDSNGNSLLTSTVACRDTSGALVQPINNCVDGYTYQVTVTVALHADHADDLIDRRSDDRPAIGIPGHGDLRCVRPDRPRGAHLGRQDGCPERGRHHDRLHPGRFGLVAGLLLPTVSGRHERRQLPAVPGEHDSQLQGSHSEHPATSISRASPTRSRSTARVSGRRATARLCRRASHPARGAFYCAFSRTATSTNPGNGIDDDTVAIAAAGSAAGLPTGATNGGATIKVTPAPHLAINIQASQYRLGDDGDGNNGVVNYSNGGMALKRDTTSTLPEIHDPTGWFYLRVVNQGGTASNFSVSVTQAGTPISNSRLVPRPGHPRRERPAWRYLQLHLPADLQRDPVVCGCRDSDGDQRRHRRRTAADGHGHHVDLLRKREGRPQPGRYPGSLVGRVEQDHRSGADDMAGRIHRAHEQHSRRSDE